MDWKGLGTQTTTPFKRGIAQGTVAADKTVNVKFEGNTVKCRALRDITTAAGDIVVAIREASELIIVGRLHAAAPDPVDPGTGVSAPEGASRSGSLIVRPVETRSYSGSWRVDNDDLYQGTWTGNLYAGWAFYGSAPLSLSGATVTSATLRMRRVSGGDSGGSAPTLFRITNSTKPAGDITTTGSSTAGPTLSQNVETTFTLPSGWGQNFADGVAGGIGISAATPRIRLAGRDTWSSSMILTLNWTRTA